MRLLVAVCSGLIGTSVVGGLREAGHDVHRLVRRDAHAPDEYQWEPPAGQLEPGAFDGVQAVLNFCGAPLLPRRWSGERKQVLVDSRVEPTEVLASAVARHGVPLLVNASAVGYYGDGGAGELDESVAHGTGFLARLCQEWEQAARAAERDAVRVVCLRTGLVLDADGGLLTVMRRLFMLGLGGKLGSGKQYMPWITLPDVTAAVRFILTNVGVHGPVNLTAPHPVTNETFTRALGRKLRRPTPWWMPAAGLRLLLGQAAQEMALASQRALPGTLTEHGYRFEHPDLD